MCDDWSFVYSYVDIIRVNDVTWESIVVIEYLAVGLLLCFYG
ncbi:hypothetical protein SHLI107390_15660 [Shewanella livingstonensis]